jgi:cell division protein FtsB
MTLVALRRFAILLAACSLSACAAGPGRAPASGVRVRELEAALATQARELAAQTARADSLEAEIERITRLLRSGAATIP